MVLFEWIFPMCCLVSHSFISIFMKWTCVWILNTEKINYLKPFCYFFMLCCVFFLSKKCIRFRYQRAMKDKTQECFMFEICMNNNMIIILMLYKLQFVSYFSERCMYFTFLCLFNGSIQLLRMPSLYGLCYAVFFHLHSIYNTVHMH